MPSLSATGNPALVRPVDATDHLLGNPAAPVVVVEYADFDCEYCKDFDTTMNQVIANEGANGQVAWVYREFPLTEIHPNAFSSAEAAECAAKVAGNDTFWKFADELFANQPVDPRSMVRSPLRREFRVKILRPASRTLLQLLTHASLPTDKTRSPRAPSARRILSFS